MRRGKRKQAELRKKELERMIAQDGKEIVATPPKKPNRKKRRKFMSEVKRLAKKLGARHIPHHLGKRKSITKRASKVVKRFQRYVQSLRMPKLVGVVYGDTEEYVDTGLTGAAQQEVIEIAVDFKKDVLQQLGAVYPLLALGKGLGDYGTVTVGPNTVGKLYMSYVTIIYDLWLAMHGEFTIFDRAPMTYWELRAACAPVKVGGHSYQFNVLDEFFGASGEFNPGVPLTVGCASLSYVMDYTQPLGILSNTIPSLTENDLSTAGVEIVTDLFNALADESVETELVEFPGVINTSLCGALYAGAIPSVGKRKTGPSTSEPGYFGLCVFENPIDAHNRWLAQLAIVASSSSERVYKTTFTGRLGVIHFADRVQNSIYWGAHGKQRHVRRPVPMTIYIESFLESIMAQSIKATMFRNEVYARGSALVDRSASGKAILGGNFESEFLQGDAGDFLYGFTQTLVRGFMGTTWIGGFDVPDSQTIPLFGQQWFVDVSVAINQIPLSLCEAKGNMSVEVDGDRILYPVLCCRNGKFTACSTWNRDGVLRTNLDDQFIRLLPCLAGMGESVPMGTPVSGLPSYIDAGDLVTSKTQGLGPIEAARVVNNFITALSGNLSLGPPVSVQHKYTSLHFANFAEVDSANQPLLMYSDWDILQKYSVKNRYKFNGNFVSAVLATPLPMIVYDGVSQRTALTNALEMVYQMKFIEPEAPYVTINNGAQIYVRPTASVISTEGNLMDIVCVQKALGGGFDLLRRGASIFGNFARKALDSGALDRAIGMLQGMGNPVPVDGLMSDKSGGGARLLSIVRMQNFHRSPRGVHTAYIRYYKKKDEARRARIEKMLEMKDRPSRKM
jgi:hypothetical protein